MSHAETSGGDAGRVDGATCQWGRMGPSPCRAPATWVSGTIAACDLHRALRDAADETTVTWRALARAAALMALPILLFLAGCGQAAPTTDDAGWVGIAIGAAIAGVLVGGILGYRIHRRECGCDPEMPEVRL